MHIDCEARDGINHINFLIKDPEYKYQCPWCRINPKQVHRN